MSKIMASRDGAPGDARELARRLAEELERRAEHVERLARDPVPEVTRHDLEEILKRNRVVFLFFTAEWCGPCISFLETFRSVALELARPGVFFGRVDVDRSFAVADKYGIQHIPTILVLLDGRVVDTIVGSMSKERLAATLRRYIEKAYGG